MMAQTDGLPSPQRGLAIAVIWVGLVMAVLDSSIVNVALPTLARELHASAAQSIWVINAYQLGTVMLLLPLAAAGELVGYRTIYMVGMLVFTLASAICVFAPTLMVLSLGRGLQGAGAAGIMSMNAALIRHAVPPRMIGWAMGGNAFVVGLSTAAGPSVASTILALASWRWLFAVNVPFCAFALALGLYALPRNDLARRPFDGLSGLLSAAAFGTLVLGADMISRGEGLGWALLAAAGVCTVLVVRRAMGQIAPLFPADLLRIPLFGLSIGVSTASFGAQLIAAVSLPFLFQRGLGRTVVETGILMTPWPVGTAIASMAAGFLSERLPSAILSAVGLTGMALGLFLLAFMPADIGNLGIVWRMAICGAGFGFFQSPNNRTMVLAAPRARSGATGGAMATGRTTGQSLGAVLVAILLRTLPLADATRWALICAGLLGVGGALISSFKLGRAEPPSASHPEATLEALADAG